MHANKLGFGRVHVRGGNERPVIGADGAAVAAAAVAVEAYVAVEIDVDVVGEVEIVVVAESGRGGLDSRV